MDTTTIWKSALSASKSLTRYLEGLTEDERTSLIEGKAKLVFSLQLQNQSSKVPDNWDPLAVVTKINTFASREAAIEWLNSSTMSKRQYQEALKSIDVPWDKADKVERLREKLVESTIGFKLRSKAIQGS